MMRRISTWKEDHGRWKESPEFGSRKTRGFTLLEILASIVILGLLTLLIFSGFHFASRMADRVKTMATLKALSQAWFLYAAENNNAFPLGLTWEVDRPIERPPALTRINHQGVHFRKIWKSRRELSRRCAHRHIFYARGAIF